MAGDWIKMRTDLYRDPKVCVMADAIMESGGDLACYINQQLQRDMTVTRNVTRNAVVGALLSVWGVMRHQGKRDGDDLLCHGVTLRVIDDIADIPGFGYAMESVGWAIGGTDGIVFPAFFHDYNTEPDSKSRSKTAERQQRYRDRKKEKSNGNDDVTRNVTVTPREEKRIEEKDKKIKDKNTAPATAVAVLNPNNQRIGPKELIAKVPDLLPQIADDFLTVRKAKRAPLTATALALIESEAVKAGITTAQAIAISTARGWQSFKAEWIQQQDGKTHAERTQDYKDRKAAEFFEPLLTMTDKEKREWGFA